MDQRDDFNSAASSPTAAYAEETTGAPLFSLTDDAKEFFETSDERSWLEPIYRLIKETFVDIRRVRVDVLWDEETPFDKPGIAFSVSSTLDVHEFWNRNQEFFRKTRGKGWYGRVAVLRH